MSMSVAIFTLICLCCHEHKPEGTVQENRDYKGCENVK